MFKLSIIFLCLAITKCMGYQCTKDGEFRDPDNPHKFYHCTNGEAFPFVCQEDLVFDESTKKCVYTLGVSTAAPQTTAAHVNTSPPTQATTAPHVNTSPPTQTTHVVGPTDKPLMDCKGKKGFFKDPTNPHQFIECVNDLPALFKCPENLVFNEAKSACDFEGTASSSSAQTSTPKSTTALNFQCPEKNGFFKDAQNAHKFIECVDGRAVEFTCPENLVFNENKKVCDYDANASGTPASHTVASTLPQTHNTDVGTQSHATSPQGPTSAPESEGTRIRHTTAVY